MKYNKMDKRYYKTYYWYFINNENISNCIYNEFPHYHILTLYIDKNILTEQLKNNEKQIKECLI
jgi:hypothetical protein